MAIENTHYGAQTIRGLLADCRSIYFIGIGGISMSSLALISRTMGFRVGGSDRAEGALIDRLREAGITVYPSHKAEQIEDYDAVVYTVAIPADNPEYVRAGERGIPRISRADYLGYLMTGYRNRVGVCGMHGKSTCTSMCALTFLRAGVDPTVSSGAELSAMGGAYHIGGREHFIFEACEYMDSFLDFNPTVAVVLNIEMDHVDYFKSMEQIRSSFARFMAITGQDGHAVINADDPNVMEAAKDYEGHILTFGVKNTNADLVAVSLGQSRGCMEFDIKLHGKHLCHVALSVPGEHQVYNALAAAGAALLCGLSAEQIADGLCAFGGAARRMEYKGRCNGAVLYDDYGHHPTEVKTTLAGAKAMVEGEGRLWCVFQSHTYSRTAALLPEFATAFADADRVVILPIYSARETDTLGMSQQVMASAIGNGARAADSFAQAAAILREELCEEDVAVIMGAGDSYRVFDLLLDNNKGESK